MKRLTSIISHVSVIGLALLALLVASVVWFCERLAGPDPEPLASGNAPAAVPVEATQESTAAEGAGSGVVAEEKAASSGRL